MPQVFSRGADTWLRLALAGAALLVVGLLLGGFAVVRADFSTGRAIAPDQPVQFSHKHHVADDGIDCRYCHTSVEESATAGFPPTHTCMTCHSKLWAQADILAPVRRSHETGEPLKWNRVHDLADFVYFDHSIHVAKGVGCTECHGPIDRMPLTRQGSTLLMGMCLECHRDPAPRLRPRDQVFNTDWKPPADRRALGERLIREYDIDTGNLTHCYICHR